jgi:regulatory protein YycI of two-component signal transduction system YycFG
MQTNRIVTFPEWEINVSDEGRQKINAVRSECQKNQNVNALFLQGSALRGEGG